MSRAGFCSLCRTVSNGVVIFSAFAKAIFPRAGICCGKHRPAGASVRSRRRLAFAHIAITCRIRHPHSAQHAWCFDAAKPACVNVYLFQHRVLLTLICSRERLSSITCQTTAIMHTQRAKATLSGAGTRARVIRMRKECVVCSLCVCCWPLMCGGFCVAHTFRANGERF